MLPAPKADEDQEDYHTYVNVTIADAVVLPTSSPDVELMGKILEDTMYQSYQIVRPAFFEIMLTSKYVRDADSATSFDIILSAAQLDVGLCYGLSYDSEMRNMIAAKNIDPLVSTYESNLSVNKGKLDALIESFAKLAE